MNCKSVEQYIVEIARNKPVCADAKQQTLQHVEACESCTMLLLDERALTTKLKLLSDSTARVTASPHLEASLQKAFRNRLKQRETVASLHGMQKQMWTIGGAIAAAFVLALVLVTFRALNSVSTQQTVGVVLSDEVMRELPISPDDLKNENVKREKNKPTLLARQPEKSSFNKPRHSSLNPRRKAFDKDSLTEIATDFIPLVQDGANIFPDSGQIVRVKFSRSTLNAFGLPVDLERADESVTADVVLSDEGIARAIRFVHIKDK
jgi:hypothetical protein